MSQENPSLFTQFRKRLIVLVIVLTAEFLIGSLIENLGQTNIAIQFSDFMFVDPGLKLGTAITYVLLIITVGNIKKIENNPLWDKMFIFFLIKLIILVAGIIVHIVAWWILSSSTYVVGWIASEVLYSVAYIFEALAWFYYGKYLTSMAPHGQINLLFMRYSNTLAFASIFAIPYYVIDIYWIANKSILPIVLQIRFILTLIGITSYIRGVIRFNSLWKSRHLPMLLGGNSNTFFNRGRSMGVHSFPPTEAKFCPKCGSPLVPGEDFCAKCGWEHTSVSNAAAPKCPECGSLLGLGGDFCTKCGWSKVGMSGAVSPSCPKCDKKMDRDGIHCPHCGWHEIGVSNAASFDCPSCGSKISMNEDVCPKCGWKEE